MKFIVEFYSEVWANS